MERKEAEVFQKCNHSSIHPLAPHSLVDIRECLLHTYTTRGKIANFRFVHFSSDTRLAFLELVLISVSRKEICHSLSFQVEHHYFLLSFFLFSFILCLCSLICRFLSLHIILTVPFSFLPIHPSLFPHFLHSSQNTSPLLFFSLSFLFFLFSSFHFHPSLFLHPNLLSLL